jgi:hypothetical protein
VITRAPQGEEDALFVEELGGGEQPVHEVAIKLKLNHVFGLIQRHASLSSISRARSHQTPLSVCTGTASCRHRRRLLPRSGRFREVWFRIWTLWVRLCLGCGDPNMRTLSDEGQTTSRSDHVARKGKRDAEDYREADPLLACESRDGG